MLKIPVLALILFASRPTFAASVETTQAKTPRGASIKVTINVPDTGFAGKRPAVILAPGQGYHMELPILKGLAEKLATSGILAFRFDWNYYSTDPQKGQPSAGLVQELEDMQSVITLAMADARVDSGQITIAGKSIGSVVAFRAFSRNSTSAKALVLLTPLCSSPTDERGNAIPSPRVTGQLNYPGLTDLTKPVVMALGNSDPACSVPQLYDWLKGTKGNVVTVVVGGDHGLNVVSDFEDLKNGANISTAVAVVSHWISMIAAK